MAWMSYLFTAATDHETINSELILEVFQAH